MTPRPPTRPVAVRLTATERETLARIAKVRGRVIHDCLRAAVRAFLATEGDAANDSTAAHREGSTA